MSNDKLQQIREDLERSRSWLSQVQTSFNQDNSSTKQILESSIEIISVHVPKTAGTLFRDILHQVYDEDQVFFDNYQLIPFMWAEAPLESIKTKHKVIHGDLAVSKYNGYYPQAKRITWLRNPILRLISNYYFLWSTPEVWPIEFVKNIIDNQMSIYQFIEIPETQNYSSKFYCQGMKLEDFYFVGIQEFFEDDLKELRALLNWPEIKLGKKMNKNKYSNYTESVKELLSDTNLLKKIVSLNREDMEQYQLALELRAKRINYPVFPGYSFKIDF